MFALTCTKIRSQGQSVGHGYSVLQAICMANLYNYFIII